ncbi:MAG TPA: DMT family transporter [Bryobacteraceae bacterium]|nr:DMT family transporter [Bryobacteraceae bacterium]
MLKPHLALYGLILLMVLCWSGNYVAAKIVFREVPSVLAMALRTLVSALLMIPIWWRRSRRSATVWTWREAGVLVVLGIFGITLNQFFWTVGVARTTVVHSSMIMATTPVWVLVMAGVTRLEKITLPKIGGMAIAMAGVALLQIFRPAASARSATVLGDFLVLLCALTFAAMTTFGKRHKPESGPVAVSGVGYIGGAIALLPMLWWSSRGFDFTRVTAAAWAGVFYMGAFSSVTGYLIYYYALARIPASRIAAFQYLQPVFASVMAVLMLGEDLSAPAVAAGGMIFAGVYVTERFG